MGSSKVIFSILAITLSLAAVTGAAAEDFTFTVPVRLLAVAPPEDGGSVDCQVGVGVPPGGGWGAAAVGKGSFSFAVDANGNFQGNVTVRFNAAAGRNPAAATHYLCWLWVTRPGTITSADQVGLQGRAKSGAPLVWRVTGALP